MKGFWAQFEKFVKEARSFRQRAEVMTAAASKRLQALVEEQARIDTVFAGLTNSSRPRTRTRKRTRRPRVDNSAERILNKFRASEGRPVKKLDRISPAARARITAGVRRYHARRKGKQSARRK